MNRLLDPPQLRLTRRDEGGTAWPDVSNHTRRGLLFKGAQALICLAVVQPDYPWLLDTGFATLFDTFQRATDPAGFAELLPHDFRRLFATEVVNTGLPIHIAAAVLGHRALDTTRGYAAIYPQEVIRHYQTFIHTRRQARPDGEYREPTDQEWRGFEQHFTLRQVAYGNCDRPYASPCIHEHACVRCPMLRPEPSRLPLLRELETNLTERITEARDHNWLGEIEGLNQTLVGLRAKTAQAERLAHAGIIDAPAQLT
jgi:Phage integrase family